VTQAWRRFLEIYEPLRPALYRFCRYLSRSPWDAEDLVQDTLARAFATLGALAEPPRDPRAWLFRVASNLWIDHVRRRGERPTDATPAAEANPAATATGAPDRGTREAAGTLLVQLSPQASTRSRRSCRPRSGRSRRRCTAAAASSPNPIRTSRARRRPAHSTSSAPRSTRATSIG